MCVGVPVWLGWSGIRVAGWSTTLACNSLHTTYIKQDAIITIRWYLTTCFSRDRSSSGQLRTTIKVQKLVLNGIPFRPNGIPLSTYFCTLNIVLSWPEDGRSRPKHVAKYHLIGIIAFCLMYAVYWRRIIYYTDLNFMVRKVTRRASQDQKGFFWLNNITHIFPNIAAYELLTCDARYRVLILALWYRVWLFVLFFPSPKTLVVLSCEGMTKQFLPATLLLPCHGLNKQKAFTTSRLPNVGWN